MPTWKPITDVIDDAYMGAYYRCNPRCLYGSLLQMQSMMPIWEPITDVIDDAYMIILSTSAAGSYYLFSWI